MKQRVVPNIFALNKEEFEKKLKILEFSKEIHLDFMDGRFTKNHSVSIEDMKLIEKYPNKHFNIHLMAYEPLKYLSKIKSLKIEKIYIQFEVYASDFALLHDLKTINQQRIKTGIVLNPSTSTNVLVPFFKYIDSIMLMSVYPGEEKQEFIEYTLSKIRDLKNQGFKGEIAFDGGIKDTNAKQIIEHGADTLYIGSYISSAKIPKENYEKVKQLIKD